MIECKLIRATFSMAAIVLALAFASGALAVQDCEVNGQSVNPANGNTTQGKSGIMRCKDRDSGTIQREQELRNGKFVGLVRHYKDGKLHSEHSVNERGNRDGRAREFSPDGQVLGEAEYRNGSKIGLSRTWYPNGRLRRIAFHDQREIAAAEWTELGQLSDLRCADKPVLGKDADDARLCGFGGQPSSVELYSGRGTIKARLVLVAGEATRMETLWDNGKPSSQVEERDGRQVERSFSRDGVKLKEIQWVLRGKQRLIEREQSFHDSGHLVTERRWSTDGRNSVLMLDQNYYLNGQLRSKLEYTANDPERRVEDNEFHDNGKPSFRGTYLVDHGRFGRPLGTHQSFDKEGRLRAERYYDAKGHISRERELDESGKVLRDDEVFEDGSRKAFAK